MQCQQQALLEASWWEYGTTDSIRYWGVSPDSGQKAAPAFTCCQSKIKHGERSPANSLSSPHQPPPATRTGYPRALVEVPRLWAAPGCVSGTFCRAAGPQVREGTREALAQGRDPQWVQEELVPGPRPQLSV